MHEVSQSMKELGYVCPRGLVLRLRLDVQEHLIELLQLDSRLLAVVVCNSQAKRLCAALCRAELE